MIDCAALAQYQERLDHYSSQLPTLKIDLLMIIPFVKIVPRPTHKSALLRWSSSGRSDDRLRVNVIALAAVFSVLRLTY